MFARFDSLQVDESRGPRVPQETSGGPTLDDVRKRGRWEGDDLNGNFRDILRKDGTNADALYVRGLCYYYQVLIIKKF